MCQENNDLSLQRRTPGTGKHLFMEIFFLPKELQPNELQLEHAQPDKLQGTSFIINTILMVRQSYEKD